MAKVYRGEYPLWPVLLTALLAGLLGWWVATNPVAGPDFNIIWTAVQIDNPYDRAALGQELGYDGTGTPPVFGYLPTAFPIFGLLALLPLAPAHILWATLSGAALAAASGSRWSPLLLITPPVLWALPGGQVTVLVGAMLYGAIRLLNHPMAAGLLFGTAAAIKPQFAGVLLIALLVVRNWKTVAWAAGTMLFWLIISALFFGLDQWAAWARSVTDFLAWHELHPNFRKNEIAPGLPIGIRVATALVATWLAARSFRLDRPVDAFIFATGLSLIASPHALGYEFALLAPVYILLLLRREWAAPAVLLFVLTPPIIWWAGETILPFYPRVVAVLLLVAATAVDQWRSNKDAPVMWGISQK